MLAVATPGQSWWPVRAVAWPRRHQLTGFFVLALGFSWLDVALGVTLGVPGVVTVGLAPVGPTLAAVAMAAVLGGRSQVGRLLGPVTIWRVGARWYMVVLVGIPLVLLAATLAVPGAVASFAPSSPVRWLLEFLVLLTVNGVLGGPLLEEPGWRGFALPRLQAQLGPLRGTLLLGLIWAVWHLPQYAIPEWAQQDGGANVSSALIFVLMVMGFAPVMTWIYNQTRGSLLLAMLAHSSVNASLWLLGEIFPSTANTLICALLGLGVAGLVLIVVTRGRLGFSDHPEFQAKALQSLAKHRAAEWVPTMPQART